MKKYIDYMHLREQLRNRQEKKLKRYLDNSALTREQFESRHLELQITIDIIDEMAAINDLCVIGEER